MRCKPKASNTNDCPRCPKNPSNLASLVHMFISEWKHHLKTELQGYQGRSFPETVWNAARSITSKQLCHAHQCYIGHARLQDAANDIKKITPKTPVFRDFQHLYGWVKAFSNGNAGHGLGELWCYDTAVRIGYNLNPKLLPRVVYLQRGAKEGARKLLQAKRLRRTIDLAARCPIFNQLEPYEAEVFLCVCKDKLGEPDFTC